MMELLIYCSIIPTRSTVTLQPIITVILNKVLYIVIGKQCSFLFYTSFNSIKNFHKFQIR